MTQRKGLLRRTVKILAVLTTIFGILLSQNGILFATSPEQMEFPPSHNFEENAYGQSPLSADSVTVLSKQLVNDSGFNLGPSASPWTSSKGGDLSDINAKIENSQSNTTIIGNKQTITIIANFSNPGEWTAMHNPACPAYPEWPYNSAIDQYWTNATGFYTRHQWREGSRQNPSINWARNINLPFDVSDYKIISASVTSVVNASVVAPSGGTSSTWGLDVSASESQGGTQFVTGDYARFYVRVADLSRTYKYDLAYNRTSPTLGQDSPAITTQTDTNMTSESEAMLKAMLTSVLSQDYHNFTVILGVDFWCEDNWDTDYDQWNLMCIKSFNLTFTFEKNINYNSYVAWSETGYRINSTEYKGVGQDITIDILNATMNFKYNLTQPWPTTSPNSEIRVYVNNYLHTETIKMSNGTTSEQFVKNGEGFNILPSLILLDQNVSIRIELIMLENPYFQLPQNCSLLMDNVTLTVYFRVTLTTAITETRLQLLSPANIEAEWNESFSVEVNYTEDGAGVGITGAGIEITNWDKDEWNFTDEGNGRYLIQFNTSQSLANMNYTLTITVDKFGAESQDLLIIVRILDRQTHLHLFLNGEDQTLSYAPEVTTLWNKTANITVFYIDTESSRALINAIVTISGTNLNATTYDYAEIGTAYEFLIDTSYFDEGYYPISLFAFLTNYSLAWKIIKLRIDPRPTFLSILKNSENVTLVDQINVPITGTITLNLRYYDAELGNAIENYTVSLQAQGIATELLSITPGTTTQLVINTNGLGFGIYAMYVNAKKTGYQLAAHYYQLNVNQIRTSISTIDYRQSYTVAPNGDLEVTVVVMDIDFNRTISGCNVTYSWAFGTGTFTETASPGVYKVVIKNVPAGEYDLYITAIKGSTYHFDIKTITVIAIAGEGFPAWLIYLLVSIIVVVSGLFLGYQRVWKYPPQIRKIRSMIKALKKGKIERKISSTTFRPGDALFTDGYINSAKGELPSTAQFRLRRNIGKRDEKDLLTQTPKVKEIPPQPAPLISSKLPPPTPAPSTLPTPPPSQHPAPVSPPPQKVPPRPQAGIAADTAPKPGQYRGLPQVKELPVGKSSQPAPKPGKKPAEKGNAYGDEKK